MNILTFDIEDWFHIKFDREFNTAKNFSRYPSILERNLFWILDKLELENTKATFFILGWIARKYPILIKEIASRGHHLGSHSDMHNLIYHLNRNEFCEDLKRSIYTIEDITGIKVDSFRSPAFSFTEKSDFYIDVLNEYGIIYDSSVFFGKRDFGGTSNFNFNKPIKLFNNNNVFIKEFPMSLLNFKGLKVSYTGGSYFRFFPNQILHLMQKIPSDYRLFYFHPRDFDPNQPLLKNLTNRRRFISYYNLESTKPKFNSFLEKYDFYNILEAERKICWSDFRI